MEKIRFHLDEQVERAVAEGLRRRKIDVTTTPEAGLLEATDPEQCTSILIDKKYGVVLDNRRIRTTKFEEIARKSVH